jgi:hypothetical protein
VYDDEQSRIKRSTTKARRHEEEQGRFKRRPVPEATDRYVAFGLSQISTPLFFVPSCLRGESFDLDPDLENL